MIRAVLLLSLALLGCGSSPPCDQPQGSSTAPTTTLSAWETLTILSNASPACGFRLDLSPQARTAALGTSSGGACAAAEGDSTCVTCAKARCCAAALACFETDDACSDAVSCIADHCAEQCPGVR